MKKIQLLERILSILTSLILLQTLYFKFTGAEESIYIFSKINMEPIGRIVVGIAEMIAGGLLLWRRTSHFGAILGLGILSGAIFFHLTILGIEVQGDGGYLFYLAVFCFINCLIITWIKRREIVGMLKWGLR